ncbi:MAG: T9SS type A sorting domain-containing protein [Saprospiraceae bacterium]|nr:T9SS type A sorting domain-containing protein [Saprospiraceae bacterium]
MVGKDTVIISCAHATQITCDTGIYVFEIGCPENLDPVYPISLACNDSVYVGNLSGWWSPEIIQTAENGESRIILEPTDGAGVFYRPDPGFEGLDYVKVSINLGADTLLYLFQVYCDLTVGNQEVSAKPVVFYPNPAGAQLLIQDAGQLLDARVYNQQGQLCPAPAKDRDGGFIIETEHLPTGFYFVIITTKQGTRLRGSFIKG